MELIEELIFFSFDLLKGSNFLLNLVVEFLFQRRDYFIFLQNEFVQMNVFLWQVQVLLFQ